MAISLSDNLAVETAAQVDVRYGPWEGSSITLAKDAAIAGIAFGVRFRGLTVGLIDTSAATVKVVEYWFDVTSSFVATDLVEKTASSSGGAITLSQTGVDISTAIQKIDVNQPIGSGLIAQAINLTGTLVKTTGITVDFTTNPQGIFTGLTTTVSPAGGTGATLSVTVVSGDVATVRIDAAGTGYSTGDVLTVIASDIGSGGSTNTSITLLAGDFYEGSLAPVSTTLNTVYDTQLSPTQVSGAAVGGVAAATPVSSLLGLNLVDIIDKILFPTQLPEFISPIAAFASSTPSFNAVVEFESAINSQVLSLSFTTQDSGGYSSGNLKRTTNNVDTAIPLGTATTSTLADLSPQYGFTNANTPNIKTAFTPTTTTFNISGPTTWTAEFAYSAGGKLKNSAGVLTSSGKNGTSEITAGSLIKTGTITPIYPYYYGTQNTLNWKNLNNYANANASVVNILDAWNGSSAGVTKVLAAASTTNLTMAFNAPADTITFAWVAIPSVYALRLSWIDTTSPSNTATITGTTYGNNARLFLAPLQNQQVSATSSGWSNVPYDIYTTSKNAGIGTLNFRLF